MKEAAIKKRLGQFFSGNKVADLLVTICDPMPCTSVIDPMAGDGDMLAAAIRAGVSSEGMRGIEIDEKAVRKCAERIGDGHVYHGDAFSQGTLTRLGITAWDLVITNPPYVRYQLLNKSESEAFGLKSAQEIRNSVSDIVRTLDHLSDDEKVCFQSIIKAYSGLSDLAVPSWILCAALVKKGGTLAMVVPESWMNREYALSIKYMLCRFFDILYIVEDVNAVWFPDVLVKTNLLVARRVELRDSIQTTDTESYRRIRLSSNLVGELSLVDGLRIDEDTGFHAFRKLIYDNLTGDGFESKSIPMSAFESSMTTASTFNRLMKKLELTAQSKDEVVVPNEVMAILPFEKCPLVTTNLSNWYIQIGQGLRTGANRFFYSKLVENDGKGFDTLRADSLMSNAIITVAQKYSLPALRYQNDVGDMYVIKKDVLPHRLLYIQEDPIDADGNLHSANDESLADHIAASDTVEFESSGKPMRFRDLSAVRTNIRTSGNVRKWYMLPELSKRHLPQLCISRVNNKNVKCVLVNSGIVVDANFSTLWAEPENNQVTYSVFALMNSSWVQACLESMATIMGGGALKVEAAHLRSLPVPVPNEQLLTSLQTLGEVLAHTDVKSCGEILNQIDDIIFRQGFGVSEPAKYYVPLRAFTANKIASRKR